MQKLKSTNMGPSTLQLHGVDLIDMQIQDWLKKLFFILHKTHFILRDSILFHLEHYTIRLQGLDIIDTYTNSIVEMYFYMI